MTRRRDDVLAALERCGWNKAAAARELGVSRATVRTYIARHKLAPSAAAMPVDASLDRVTRLLGPDGEQRMRWERWNVRRQEQLEQIESAVKAAFSDAKRLRPVRPPRRADDDLLAVYPLGDPHVGMLSWRKETGESFDLHKAERIYTDALRHLTALAPPAKHCLLVNLGDYFHSDWSANVTMRSGHALDVDGRWGKVLEVGVRILRRLIDLCLAKHERVTVVNAVGNHDDHSSQFLQVALGLLYENDPRAEVPRIPGQFYYHPWGANLIGVTHGDKIKLADLAGIMAVDRAEDWSARHHRYWYTGHIHNRQIHEQRGCLIETFRTLAPRDAYAHSHGYRSGRDCHQITLHRERGEIARQIYRPEWGDAA